MTRKQVLVLIPIAALLAAGVVVAHLLLPVASASWTVNRVLHYGCEGAAGAAAVGGIVWIMWPRAKPRRRDAQREHARRRVVALAGVIVTAVALVVFAEVHRERASRARLAGTAAADLRAVGRAVRAYAGDHGGQRPEKMTDLVPRYLQRDRLYYAFRHGPTEAPPPQAGDEEASETPTYALVRTVPRPGREPPRDPLRAYLRPGHAWAPLTVILEKDGRCRVVGEDRVARYETRREQRR